MTPQDWKVIELGTIADVTKLAGFEYTAHVTYSDLGKVIALRGLNVKHGYLDLEEVKYIDASNFSKLARSKLYKDDMLFTYVGTIGEVALVDKNDKYYLAPNVSRIRFQKSAHPKFMLYQFTSPEFIQSEINPLIASTTQAALSMTNIRLFKVLNPPLNEQTAIAEALSDADSLIASLEKLIAKKKAIKQGAMQELLTGRKRLPGFSGEWVENPCSDLGVFFKGKGISMADTCESGYSCIMYGDIYVKYNTYFSKADFFISCETAKGSTQAKAGDLFFTSSGETAEEIGKCVVYLGINDIYIGGDIIAMRPSPDVDSLFLAYAQNSSCSLQQKKTLAQGHTVVHIGLEQVKGIKVLLPPTKAEQTAIAAILSDMDTEIEQLEKKLAKYRVVKQGMMQELLTGRIRLIESAH